MKTYVIDGVEIHTGSGNVFADLNLPDAGRLKVKSELSIQIQRAMKRLGINQKEAALRMGIPQPKLSALLRGGFDNISEHKLMNCLNRLGYDIEINVRPANQETGYLTLAMA